MNQTSAFGSKFSNDLDVVQIAKLVRAEIKAALKSGALPAGLKVSVRAERHHLAASIRATITDAPFNTLNPDHVSFVRDEPHMPVSLAPKSAQPRHSEKCRVAMKLIEKMLNAYNHDDSDIMTDYFNRNFYETVEVHHDLEDEDWRACLNDLDVADELDAQLECAPTAERKADRNAQIEWLAGLGVEA